MRLLVIGAPGSGKGTEAELLSQKLGIPHISAGDLLRDEIARKTPEGIKLDAYLSKGELAPNSLVNRILKARLEQSDCSNGFLLDGFPRTLPQAKLLQKWYKLDKAILLEVPDEIAVLRLSQRRQCRQCHAIFRPENMPKGNKCPECNGEVYQRDDDKPAAIRERLKEFHSISSKVIEFFDKEGIIARVDATDCVQEVLKRILASLEKN